MIYLDHAAATPVTPKALAAMTPYFSEQFFNPSAPYLPAKHVRTAYEAAKDDLAHVIGAKGVDLVITAGATESINLAFTVLDTAPNSIPPVPTKLTRLANTVRAGISFLAPRALVLSTEHAAVLAAARQYAHDLIKVDHSGLIDLADLRQKLTDQVVLISVSLANNELGTIQPLAEIAELVRQTRQDRLERGITTPLYLHSDASQALSLIDINVARLGVDLLTLNAAKCGGPKGVGALYVGHDVQLRPVTVGGGQERGLRSGTENVPGVMGFAAAAVEAKKHLGGARKQYQKMAQTLRQAISHIPTKTPATEPNSAPSTTIVAHNNKKVKHNLHAGLAGTTRNAQIPRQTPDQRYPEPIFLGNPKHQLASFVPVCFPGIDAERLIYKLEQQGIYVSTGAACAANKGTKSHVLAAIGLSDEEIAGSLRISLGSTNTLEQIETAAQIIVEAVRQEYDRLCVARSRDVKLKEQSASCEEGEPREDGRSTGARGTVASGQEANDD